MMSFDHAILQENSSAENGMEVKKSINHVTRKATWQPAYEISSLSRDEGQYLNFTCSMVRPFEIKGE
jgi:hypothetical protein